MKQLLMLLATAIVASMAFQARAQDAAAGRKLAQDVCAECHVVDGPGVIPTSKGPGFVDIARIPSTTELSLKVFLQSHHNDMPAINLTQRELDDVTAYILSLNNRT